MLIGRNIEIQKIVSMLTNDKDLRLISVKGLKGLGKRPIATYALKYCMDRNFFQEGCYQVDVGNR